MKAIMVMYDSLNRKFLPPYGCDWVKAPNFQRLYEHTVAFDNCYVGSLPCMPARRELHTGRYNFLHRGWSPLEPFDDSMPELLSKAGIATHLTTDHDHYWEDGGATYHTRYSSWEGARGQENDQWKTNLDPSIKPETILPSSNEALNRMKMAGAKHNAVNRHYIRSARESSQRQVFDNGLSFLEDNHGYDNWFLQIEAFDPHEPFFTFEEYLKLYEIPDIGRELDWPPYDRVSQTPEEIRHLRMKYAALLSQCDESLGRVLDFMDEHDMWKDTMLIVNTDHGFLLGEHGWWSKNVMPCFDEIVHTPLFVWDPRCKKQAEHRQALVQTIDLAPTLLEYFGQPVPKDMQGKPLRETVENDAKVRDYALFGYHGSQMNITDGRWVYMRSPRNQDGTLYEYTLMPTRMNARIGAELESATLAKPFSFTKNMPVLRLPARNAMYTAAVSAGDMLFDLQADPDEAAPVENAAELARMEKAMAEMMRASDAPEELFDRFGL